MANRNNRKYKWFDDGFHPDYIRNASLDGRLGMPAIDRDDRVTIPGILVPFSKVKYCKENNIGLVFYEDDKEFVEKLNNLESDECLSTFDRSSIIVTPDYSISLNVPPLVKVFSIYKSRAIGVKLQDMGYKVVPNVRCGDGDTFTSTLFPEPPAFLGIPKHWIVSVGSYGICDNIELKSIFRRGLIAMLDYLEPETVLVYGPMPNDVFGDLLDRAKFIRFDDWNTFVHRKGSNNGAK